MDQNPSVEDVMFSNRRIEVSIGKTVNLGGYNSLKIGASFGTDVSDGENIDEIYNAAYEMVSHYVDEFIVKERGGDKSG